MSTAQLKTLKLEIRIPYSDTPYFLQLHSSSTVSHLKSKLFRKTSSLQGRKLDSYALAVKRQHSEAYDSLHEDKKVVKSHPLIEDEYHKNKLVTLYLIRSVDLNGDLSPKSVMSRGTSETQLRSAPLTSPARFSIMVPSSTFPLPPEGALAHAQSVHGVTPSVIPFSPPSHTLLVRSKSEPSIRGSLSNSLTNLPLYQLSSPPSDFASLLSNSTTTQNFEYGTSSETGSEPLSSHCDSDTESVEDIAEEKEQSLSATAPTLPAMPQQPYTASQSPPDQPPQSPTLSRGRANTDTSHLKPKGGKAKLDKAVDKEKKRDKTKSKHLWWTSRREDKSDKDYDSKKDKEGTDGKRLSIKIPHLHSHTALTYSSSPGYYTISSSPMTGHSSGHSTGSDISLKSSFSSPLTNETSPHNSTLGSPPPSLPTSPQSTSPITPPLTPTPLRAHANANAKNKFQAQGSTPSKFTSASENDLSNKRGNAGLVVEEEPSGKLVVVAGTVDELINCLADKDIPDKAYCEVFMSTLNYFTTMEYVLKKLIERYEYTCDDPTYTQKWRPIIQTRVLKVLRSTLESHEYLFSRNPSLLVDLRRFLESVRHSHPNKMAVREFDSLLRSTASQPTSLPVQHSPSSIHSPPSIHSPSSIHPPAINSPTSNHSPPSTNSSHSLQRTASGTQHTVVIPIDRGSMKPSSGSSNHTLTRSSSSTFISLTSSHGSSSSSFGSNSTGSPNGSPSSFTLILSSVAADPSLHDSKKESSGVSPNLVGKPSTTTTTTATAVHAHLQASNSQLNLLAISSSEESSSSSSSSAPNRHYSTDSYNSSSPSQHRRDSITTQENSNPLAPPPSKKNKSSKFILKVRPIDMAKQFTLIEKELFCKITPTDLMMAAWKKKDKGSAAPNVVRVITWFNKVTAWAQTIIVLTGSLRERISVLSRIIQIAEHCIEQHNYSTGMELVSGLRCSSVSRLTKTWKGLGKKELAAWESMSEIFDAQGNFTTYRRLIHLAHGEPALPYLGVVLQDLLMVEELPTMLTNNMVNFKKMRRFAHLLRDEILDRQVSAKRYSFEASQNIQEYFDSFIPLSDPDLYKLSRICEPAALA